MKSLRKMDKRREVCNYTEVFIQQLNFIYNIRNYAMFFPIKLNVVILGNKHKWVPLVIEVKSEGPRERSASRNNTRQYDGHRIPPNNRNDLRGISLFFYFSLSYLVKFPHMHINLNQAIKTHFLSMSEI